MSPRPRNAQNRGLPVNLYCSAGLFRYRDASGKYHPMGTDKRAAIAAAKELNAMRVVKVDLVARVLGGRRTLGDFIATYQTDILPPRKLAKATLDLYEIRLRQAKRELGSDRPIDSITLSMISDVLDALTARVSNQLRAVLVDVFAHAVAKGLCPDNPAALTIPRIEEVARKRHTLEGLMAIRAVSEDWLKNAIDLALVTAQRRGDILAMRFKDVEDGYLHVIQHKTKKASDAGYLRICVTPQRKAVIDRCRDNIPSPFMIHRKPERTSQEQQKGKEHWTKVEDDYLTRAFKEARDLANPYPNLTEAQQPGFHQIRALAIHLMKAAGKDAQKLAGHAQAKMTKNYEAGHEEIVWTTVDDEVIISAIS